MADEASLGSSAANSLGKSTEKPTLITVTPVQLCWHLKFARYLGMSSFEIPSASEGA